MKKLISGMFIGVFVSLLVFNFTSYAETSGNVVKLIVNGVTLQDELQPISLDGRIYVSARSLSEALGASVNWDSEQNAVIVNSIKVDVVKPVAPNVINPVVNPVVDDKVKTDVDKTSVNTTVAEPVQSGDTNTNPLRLDSIGETTYETIGDGTYKKAYVTVTITNTSDKYVDFIRLKPIVNVNDGRNFGSALDSNKSPSKLEGGYYKPNSNITLVYWASIPNDVEVTGWKLP